MGNMLGAKKFKLAEEKHGLLIMERRNVESSFAFKSLKRVKPTENRGRKVVRFHEVVNHEVVVDKESDQSLRNVRGVVKFKIAVTKEELVQILNCKKGSRYSSVEELLEEMKVKSRKISHVRTDDGGSYGCQKLKVALKNIAEDH
ncbi:hypothetical protein FRX31_003881 [Thalictrum thalictroides]|uniref:Uncharacterized protein n=1 Tax=Thalictrum thalictroides TaxID=46969 RepID=A0A7J6XA90_THATH|nr:hypothetical protein FRX31_003881 [Thalictrum thalictroides]